MSVSRRLLFALLLVFFSISSVAQATAARGVSGLQNMRPRALSLNEISVGSGFVHQSSSSSLRHHFGNPVFIRVGLNVSSLAGLRGYRSGLQLALEPFYNTIHGNNKGFETGCGFGARYFHKLTGATNLFLEATVAPMYLGIDSREQGRAGFNFLDQIGLGVQHRLSDQYALFSGYRLRHISHAGIVDRPNSGINSGAFIAGISYSF